MLLRSYYLSQIKQYGNVCRLYKNNTFNTIIPYTNYDTGLITLSDNPAIYYPILMWT